MGMYTKLSKTIPIFSNYLNGVLVVNKGGEVYPETRKGSGRGAGR